MKQYEKKEEAPFVERRGKKVRQNLSQEPGGFNLIH